MIALVVLSLTTNIPINRDETISFTLLLFFNITRFLIPLHLTNLDFAKVACGFSFSAPWLWLWIGKLGK